MVMVVAAIAVASASAAAQTRFRADTGASKKAAEFSDLASFYASLPVVERVPLEVAPTEVSRRYLKTKKEKLGHLLSLV